MKKFLAFVLLVSFISAAGLMFSGCSGDKKNNVTNGGGSTPVYSFEGTWESSGGFCIQFTGSNAMYDNPPYSYKGTFTYDSTHIFFYMTLRAYGNAFTESVTWSDFAGGSTASYSFIDEDHIDINGFTYTKIS